MAALKNLKQISNRALSMALLVLLVFYLIGENNTSIRQEEFQELELGRYHRMIVISPHNDDETLGAGGLIQEAIATGLKVQVVVATNGDGYLFATMEDFHVVYPRKNDFIRMGYIRQQETLNAMQDLGLPPGNVIFLSYPDRGTGDLWNTYWDADHPYRSPFSQQTRSPYPLTYNPVANYSGESLLSDIRSIFRSYQPDLIIFPHPADVHIDHWGLSAFTRLAISLEEVANPDFRPDALAYLVHRPDFPQPKGLKATARLIPPRSLLDLEMNESTWYRFELTEKEVQQKKLAIEDYSSQQSTIRKLLESFIRQNEIFERIDSRVISKTVNGEELNPLSWKDLEGKPVLPVEVDPVTDTIARRSIPSADITAVYLTQFKEGTITLCANLHGLANPLLTYTLRIIAVGEKEIIHVFARNNRRSRENRQVKLVKNFVCGNFGVSDLGHPRLLFVGVDVEQFGTGIIDQSAWQEIFINEEFIEPVRSETR